MKKLIILTIPIIVLGLVVTSHSAYADDGSDHNDTSTSTTEETVDRDNLRDKMREERGEQKEEAKDRMQEMRDKMSSSTHDRASTTRDEVKNRLDEKRDEVRQELRQKLADRFKDRLAQHLRLIMHRFEAAIGRLEKLSERIDSRLEKLAERDIDVTEAEALLEVANIQIGVAKTAVSNLPSELEALSADGLTKEDFEVARGLINTAKDEIKAAHAALVDVIRNIKAGLNKDSNDDDSDDDSVDDEDNN